uniref:Uncharacterized protein n=1 Tax=Siphoviridae sp. ct16C7 TaxID=2825304 RepID=A0A8S5NY85_9CAUD|nr:MAG TPA: hypothetical protein [Siphoviridae sp. ct16C7]
MFQLSGSWRRRLSAFAALRCVSTDPAADFPSSA